MADDQASARQDLASAGTLSTTSISSQPLASPIRGFRFTASFNGLGTASFKSVEGFSIDVASSEYREGAFGRLTVRKLPGLATFSDITLTKGLYSNMELYTFFTSYLEGQNLNPVDGVITTYDNSGTATASWSVLSAWPIRYEPSGLNADNSEIIIETLVLANEGVFRDLTPRTQ
ncbi:MAG: phage tail protein [Candidatus Improbicoccus pseudotrichonymphae]|uniref:Phage tail protein n=1 Tax=Candidatus Improbicoccus pseudotrichonymphae TaxID=3033792 RepID=A0AA48HVE6_9FIRM|nr:MAG: phage tail protein [Candidatus Improbicoccus pseudotrichonymphae]